MFMNTLNKFDTFQRQYLRKTELTTIIKYRKNIAFIEIQQKFNITRFKISKNEISQTKKFLYSS